MKLDFLHFLDEAFSSLRNRRKGFDSKVKQLDGNN